MVRAAHDCFSADPLTLQGPEISEICSRLTLAALLAQRDLAEVKISRGVVTRKDWAHQAEVFEELFGLTPERAAAADLPWRPLPNFGVPAAEQRFCLHDDYWVQALRNKKRDLPGSVVLPQENTSVGNVFVSSDDALAAVASPAIPAPPKVTEEVRGASISPDCSAATAPGATLKKSPIAGVTRAAPSRSIASVAEPLAQRRLHECRFKSEGRWRVFEQELLNFATDPAPRESYSSAAVNTLSLMLFRAETAIAELYKLLTIKKVESLDPKKCNETALFAISGFALCALIQEDCDSMNAAKRVVMRDPAYLFDWLIRDFYKKHHRPFPLTQFEEGFSRLKVRSERWLPLDYTVSPFGIHCRVSDAVRRLGYQPFVAQKNR